MSSWQETWVNGDNFGKGSPAGLVSDSTVPASLPAAPLSLDSVFSPHPTSAKVPSSVTNFLSGNKGAADSLAKATAFKKSHINNGGSPIPQLITAAYNAQSEANKVKARSQAIANANGSSLDFT